MSRELQTALIAAAGALVGQFLIVAGEMDEGRVPDRVRKRPFWFATVCWILVAALVGWLEGPLPRLASFEVGVGIKLFLNQLGRSIPGSLSSDEQVK